MVTAGRRGRPGNDGTMTFYADTEAEIQDFVETHRDVLAVGDTIIAAVDGGIVVYMLFNKGLHKVG